ncbi:hypothetical protein, partial [Telmatospirillum sp.]|uniref:hypothetical protein n=1 Tax=Telmatospirillum sp. TaxID=2079197 RepID=UPI00284A2C92
VFGRAFPAHPADQAQGFHGTSFCRQLWQALGGSGPSGDEAGPDQAERGDKPGFVAQHRLDVGA